MLAKSKELIIIIIIFAIAGTLFFLGLARYKNNVDKRNEAAVEANRQQDEMEEEATSTEDILEDSEI